MRILLSGGGTAGHVNPAVAIADALVERECSCEVAFVGREGGEEYGLVDKRGYPLYRIRVEGLSRKNPIKAAKSLFIDIGALKRAREIITAFAPDVIIGTGGYVCAPVLLSGHMMKIPTVIHESNAYPGLATRMLSRVADRILLNFECCKRHLGEHEKIRVVGNPTVSDFTAVARDTARRRLGIGRRDFFIASFGGSGGAMMLNTTVIELMKAYSTKTPEIRHIHAVGRRYYPEIKSLEPQLCRGTSGCKILPYIDNMPTVMAAADLVISRSGATTLSEITAVGVPSILIPSPNVSDNHQLKNASLLYEVGAARLIEEKNLTLRLLMDTVSELHSSPELCEQMRRAAKGQHKGTAKSDTVGEIYSLLKAKK